MSLYSWCLYGNIFLLAGEPLMDQMMSISLLLCWHYSVNIIPVISHNQHGISDHNRQQAITWTNINYKDSRMPYNFTTPHRISIDVWKRVLFTNLTKEKNDSQLLLRGVKSFNQYVYPSCMLRVVYQILPSVICQGADHKIFADQISLFEMAISDMS